MDTPELSYDPRSEYYEMTVHALNSARAELKNLRHYIDHLRGELAELETEMDDIPY